MHYCCNWTAVQLFTQTCQQWHPLSCSHTVEAAIAVNMTWCPSAMPPHPPTHPKNISHYMTTDNASRFLHHQSCSGLWNTHQTWTITKTQASEIIREPSLAHSPACDELKDTAVLATVASNLHSKDICQNPKLNVHFLGGKKWQKAICVFYFLTFLKNVFLWILIHWAFLISTAKVQERPGLMDMK